LLAGVMFSKFFKHYTNLPPVNLFTPTEIEPKNLPGLTESIVVAISPVIFMLSGTLLDFILGPLPEKSIMVSEGFLNPKEYYQFILMDRGLSEGSARAGGFILSFLKFLSDANMALMLAVLLGLWLLGIRKGRTMEELMQQLGVSVSAIAMILLIIGAGGAFSEVLKAGRVNEYIAMVSNGIQFNPLIIAFSIAAILRFAVGSATVATMTAAPIVLPMAVQFQVPPELMVLATGSGSLMFSHFNDVGFWMFKEYFNLNIKQTFLIWSVMETIVALVGLGFCLIVYYMFF
jgi:H+/gluconate symporter-like permease